MPMYRMLRPVLGKKEVNIPLGKLIKKQRFVMLIEKDDDDYYVLVHMNENFVVQNVENYNALVDNALLIYGAFSREVGLSILKEYKRLMGNTEPLYQFENTSTRTVID